MEPIPPGSAGDPRHFVGRARTTEIAAHRLAVGVSLSLTDPRRMGKTSWIDYFCATTQEYTPVVIDYQGVRTSTEFLLRTAEKLARHQGLSSKARSTLSGFFGNFESVGVGPITVNVGVHTMSATELLTTTMMAVNQHATGRPVLVCMDEVPWAIRNITRAEGPQAASELLQTLRALRADAQRLRWIVCGSIGFHHVLRQSGSTSGEINDLDNLPLGPLASAESEELAHRLLVGARRTPSSAAIAMLSARCGGIPFLMHKVASLLQDAAPGAVSEAEVESAFFDFIDDRDESHSFHASTRTAGPQLRHGSHTGKVDPGPCRRQRRSCRVRGACPTRRRSTESA